MYCKYYRNYILIHRKKVFAGKVLELSESKVPPLQYQMIHVTRTSWLMRTNPPTRFVLGHYSLLYQTKSIYHDNDFLPSLSINISKWENEYRVLCDILIFAHFSINSDTNLHNMCCKENSELGNSDFGPKLNISIFVALWNRYKVNITSI